MQSNKTFPIFFFLILTLILRFANAQSQKSITINGQVTDSLQQPLLNVAVTLYQDEKLIKYTLTDAKGLFAISSPTIRNGKLKLSLLGYTTRWIELKIQESDYNTGAIALSLTKNELGVVKVMGRRNLLQQTIDRLAYDVKNDPERKTANTFDILRKVPLVSIGPKEELTVNGRQSFVILIDGKPSGLLSHDPASVLRSLPAGRVEKIELITTPASRFSRNGTTEVINIITSDRNFKGLQNNVRATYTTLNYFNGNATTEFRNGKLGVSNYLRYFRTAPPQLLTENYYNNNTGKLNQTGDSKSRFRNFADIPEISYELDSLSLIQINAEWSDQIGSGTNFIYNNFRGQNPYQTSTNTLLHNNGFDQAYSLYYQRQGKKNHNKLLTLGYRFGKNNRSTTDTIFNQSLDALSILKQDNNTRSKEHTFQIDYAHPIKNQVWESGMKVILRDNQSNGRYIQFDQNSSVLTALSNKQDVYSAYQSYYYKNRNWGAKAIIRFDYTKINGDGVSQNYFNFLPSVALQKKLKSSVLTFNYDVLVERPAIWQLNNFTNLSNPNFATQGNAALRPATIHRLDLSLRMNTANYYKHSIYGEFSRNMINNIQEKLNDTALLNTFRNIGSRNEIGFKSNISYQIKKGLDLNFNGRISYVSYSRITDDIAGNSGVEFLTTSGLSYLLKNGYRFDTYIRVSNPYVGQQGNSYWWTDHSLGVNKKFFNNRLNTTLTVSNPLLKYRRRFNELNSRDFESRRLSKEVIREIYISIAYRIGGLRASLKKSEKQISNSDLKTQPAN